MKYDLSILIPARNEMFLARTVQDIIQNIEGKTEIIVVLDGAWADPTIDDDPRVTIVYLPQPIGQRAATNLACRLSTAKYVLKVDAHCAFDRGFDKKLMADMQDDWTVVPVMRNLHIFDWMCPDGHRRYQSPSGTCKECGKETTQDVVWIAKTSPQSTSYCFDPEPHFQYFNEYKKRQEGDLVETMSLQGSAFMLTRKKYWELNICDEAFGSWGSQGIEVAVKTWLSGGKVIVNKKTWYAHLFRTQGGDFSFPYQQAQSKVDEAKQHAKDLFFNNKWDKAIRPLSWLVEKFWPVYRWEEKDLVALKASESKSPRKGILYYTTNRLNVRIAKKVQRNLEKMGLPITSVSLKPMTFGRNIWLKLEPGIKTYFTQIITGLENMKEDIVFMCEHDVLYHKSHFDFIPPKTDKFYYNQNFWRIRKDGFAVHFDANQVSGLVAYRTHLIAFYKAKLQEIDKQGFDRSYEPGGRKPEASEAFNSEYPNIDIRGDWNVTKSKWSPADFRDKTTCKGWKESTIDKIDGWDNIKSII